MLCQRTYDILGARQPIFETKLLLKRLRRGAFFSFFPFFALSTLSRTWLGYATRVLSVSKLRPERMLVSRSLVLCVSHFQPAQSMQDVVKRGFLCLADLHT